MIGRRVYPPQPDKEMPHPLPIDCRPGDYWFDPTLGYWMIYAPKGGVGSLANHKVIEHEDGTITVSPSILQNAPHNETWHGYLEKGIWREV